MKNPFEKRQSSALIAGIILSSVAAGTIAYLFMTENGSDVREQLKATIKGLISELTGTPAKAPHPEHIHHETAYQNKRKPKTKKSDKEKILKHEITGHHDEHSETPD